jgi:MFS family permease
MNKKLFWLFALSSSVYFVQGIEGLPSQALFYYMKETLSFPAEKIMWLSSLTISAWLVKPILGYLIDNFFNKKAWIYLSLVLDLLLVLLLGLLHMPIFWIVVALILTSTGAAFRDVAADGIMCVEGKAHSMTGKIQSIQWLSISVAMLINGVMGGLIAEYWGYRQGFLCLIPFYLATYACAYFYRDDTAGVQKKRSSFKGDMKLLFSNKRLLIVALFIFLYKYSPSFGTPLMFIQRDSFKWDKVFIGVIGTAGTVFSIFGSLLYYKFSQKINIRKWLYVSVFLGALTTLTYLYYTPYTAVIYDVVYSFIGMFIFLMIMDFMARTSAPGLEATSFAFLCSFSNLALVASSVSGAFLYPLIGLKWLIVLSSATSFLCLPLLKYIW